MFRIAPEGWPFISVTAGISLIVLGLFRPWVAIVPLILTLFVVFFFRDPDRVIPEGENLIVSPADGKIISVERDAHDSFLDTPSLKISIFMSPLNVHINRAPADGEVLLVEHHEGSFRPAYTDEAALENENITMILNTSWGKILVRQIAGLIARRAVCRVKVGDHLKKGQRYGLIKFGSRVDIFLPSRAECLVNVGDTVRGGSSILARMKEQ